MKKILFFLGMMVSLNNVNAQWSAVGGSNSFYVKGGFVNWINVIKIDKVNNVYATGFFYNANSNVYVAKWNGTNWSELGGTNTSIFNNDIKTLIIDTSGNIYVAGFFTNSSGSQYVAKFNGNSWIELGGSTTSTFYGNIYTTAIDTIGSIYTAGDFTNANGKQYVAKWNGTSWLELGGSNTATFNGRINALVTDLSNNLYAVGNFKNANGKQYVAKWNGNSWSELGGSNTSIFNFEISAITTDKNGNIYTGDDKIAKWDGTNWAILGNHYFSWGIRGLTVDTANNIYAGGNYQKVGNFQYFYLSKWDGTNWSDILPTPYWGAPSRTFATDLAGNLYAGGDFTLGSSCYVAKYTPQPLPLKLLSFNAKQQTPNSVALNWQTANEVNVSHFNIQRSNNGKDFKSIGKVNTSCCNYDFQDSPPMEGSGVVYYRLEIVDKDGSKQYSEIRTLNFKPQTLNSINIYPNPAKDNVNIECAGVKELVVIDNLGKTIYKSSVNSPLVTINTKQFTKGIYLVKVVYYNGEIKTEKLLVE